MNLVKAALAIIEILQLGLVAALILKESKANHTASLSCYPIPKQRLEPFRPHNPYCFGYSGSSKTQTEEKRL